MNINTGSTLTSPSGAKKIGMPTTGKLPKVKDPSINVRDHLNDILLGEKHLITTYSSSLNESMQPELRAVLAELRDRTMDAHWQVFTHLFGMGEYQADLASPEQIKDVVDVFSNYETQIPYGTDGRPLG